MKKKRNLILLIQIIMIFTTVGCKNETYKLETKPKFNIILMDQEIREYIEKAKKNPENIDKLYREIILEPIFGETDSNSADYYVQKPIKNLDELKKELDILVEEDIANIVENTLTKCTGFITGADTTVYIFPANPNDSFTKYKMGGINGFGNINTGEILLFINPTSENWRTSLTYAVAHEYHHVIWGDRNYKEKERTLLEYLILEGRADSFTYTVFSDIEIPWTYVIPIDKEKAIWEKIKQNLDNKDANYQYKVMFGDYEEFPPAIGYTIGHNIMQEFIKNNPDVSIDEWTNMDAKDILEKSGYEKKFENKK